MLDGIPDRALANRARERAPVEPQPTLAGPFYSAVCSAYHLDGSVANVGYVGVFYPTRGLTEVVEPLHSLDRSIRSR